MKKTKIFSNYLKSLRSDPIFVVLDSLYYQNPDSSIHQSMPAPLRYARLLNDLDRILYSDLPGKQPVNVRELPFSRIFSLAEMILFSIVNCNDILFEVMRPEYRGDYFLYHTLNVTFLSCQAAIGLGLSYKDLTQLCVVSLLHDFGMQLIDKNAFSHDKELSENQRRVIDKHFEKTYEYFKSLQNELPFLLRVIEEEDNRLKKGLQTPLPQAVSIDLSDSNKWFTFSELVSMCNKFEALCHDRSYRKAYHPAEAMRIFVEENKQQYERRLIRAIIESISLYPITSLVRLNNNRIGRVIDIVEGCPLSPLVAIVTDYGKDIIPDEPELTGETIDLSQKPTIFIESLVYSKHYQH